MRRILCLAALAAIVAACGHRKPAALAPTVAPGELTAAQADSAWAEAVHLQRSGKWADLQTALQRLSLEVKPTDRRMPLLHFLMGEAHLGLKDNLQAAREFRKVSDEYPADTLAPDALLRVGDAYRALWRRPELDPTYGSTALSTFQEVLSRYPGSAAAKRAQLRVQELQDDLAYKQYKAALYYMRLRAWDSAILYLRDVVATYPRAAVAPQALVRLVRAYRAVGYEEDAREACGYIRRFHPKAEGVGEVCPAVPADTAAKGR